MAEGSGKDKPIEALLEERAQILKWLDRLSMAVEGTPEDVRVRVRSDYETRLDAVAGQLNQYTEELQRSLDQHIRKRTELLESEKATEARLAESKLRHAVGEFGEDRWNTLHSEIMAQLVTVRENLKGAEGEITRLDEVLTMIRSRPSQQAQVVEAEPDVPSPERVEQDAPPPPPPSPPAAPPAQPAEDLAFLKKMAAEEERPGPKPAHQEAAPPNSAQAPPPPPGGSGDSGPKKTLKCGECGVLNFPTEWYCERCGAELAAL